MTVDLWFALNYGLESTRGQCCVKGNGFRGCYPIGGCSITTPVILLIAVEPEVIRLKTISDEMDELRLQ